MPDTAPPAKKRRARRPAKPTEALATIRRPLLTTKEAAAGLGYAPSTLRHWATERDGPISPVRLGRSLRWRTNDVRALANLPPLPLTPDEARQIDAATAQARAAADAGVTKLMADLERTLASVATLREAFAAAMKAPATP
jgi:predicted DNA-binding transcriptional regulator AlpA